MKKVIAFVAFLIVAGALAVGTYFWMRNRHITFFAHLPYGSEEAKRVEVPSGSGPRAVSNLLAQAQVVSSADDFYAYLRREKLGPRLKAGEYEFSGLVTPAQVAEKLSLGQVKVYRFTVPEGLRMEEILPILAGSELKLDLARLQQLSNDPLFRKRAGIPSTAESMEGFLYPDTYSFTRPFDEASVLTKMVSRALDEYKKADAQRQSGITFGLMQTLTLASIIEKETGVPSERPRISCVFHNRLKVNMKLQTDPTVLYAMRLLRGSFVKNITSKDLVTPHPYNTYTTAGLPPGPIASPGAAAIQAALDPMECKDLYFVSKNNGTHIFCPDLKCHLAAVDEWQRRYWSKKPASR